MCYTSATLESGFSEEWICKLVWSHGGRNPWTSVLPVATGKRISYCVHTYAGQTLQQERPFSHPCAAPVGDLKCDSISLLQGTCPHSVRFHAPRWLFLVFHLRIIAFLQDPLETVVHAWNVKDSSLQLMIDIGGLCTIYFLGSLAKSRLPLLPSLSKTQLNDLVLRRKKTSS